MERRLFLTGLLGVAGTAGIAAMLPRQALAAVPMGPAPQANSVLPDLSAPSDEAIEPEGLDELGDTGRRRPTRQSQAEPPPPPGAPLAPPLPQPLA